MSNKKPCRERNRSEHEQEMEQKENAANTLLALQHERTVGDIESANLLLAFSQQTRIRADSTDIEDNINTEHNQQQRQQQQQQEELELSVETSSFDEHQQQFSVLREQLEQDEMLHFTYLATTPERVAHTSLEPYVQAMLDLIGAGMTALAQAILYLEHASWDLNTARNQWREDQNLRANNDDNDSDSDSENKESKAKTSGKSLHDLEIRFIRNAFCRPNVTNNPRPDYDGICRDHSTFLAGVFLPGELTPCPDRSSSSIAAHINRKILSKVDKKLNAQGKWKAARKAAGHDMEKEKQNFWYKHGGGGGPPGGDDDESAAGGQNMEAAAA